MHAHTNLGKRRGNYRNRPSGPASPMLWVAGVKGPGLKGGGTDHIQPRSWLSKGRLCGPRPGGGSRRGKGRPAGPGRYLAHPTPHGRAALSAPCSREEPARAWASGRGGGRRRQGGARRALRRRHGMAGPGSARVGDSGPSPRGRTPGAHAHLSPQFSSRKRAAGGGGRRGRGVPKSPKAFSPGAP